MTDVIGGVDTHRDTHMAAVIDTVGTILGVEAFPADPRGYAALRRWMASHGTIIRIGVEGTGTYGAGLARHLLAAGETVVEIDRPNRQRRRREGKSDPIDAIAAARAAAAGEGATAKDRTGAVEAIRVLRVARRSARFDRTKAINQLRCLVATAPDEVREPLRHMNLRRLLDTTAALRPGTPVDAVGGTRVALRELARRIRALDAELARLDDALEPLIASVAPQLLEMHGVGPDSAGALIVAVGEHPGRLRNEAAFARLCGVAPLEASSGTIVRHRLSRAGDRQANSALWRIVLVRMRSDPETRAYVARRTAEGLTKREIMRCLKRYLARQIYQSLRANELTPSAC